jgi:hypothetical protein
MASRNFGRTNVVVAPSPALSGLAFTVTANTGAAKLGHGPAVLCPADVNPWETDSVEVVKILKVSGDTITLSARAQEGTTAQTVATGWQVIQGVTAGMWGDVAPDLVAELYATSQFTIGHRLGGGDEAPENTEIGSQQALGKGQLAVELSSQATADGVMIAMHDSTLTRTTSLTGNVSDTSMAQLRSSPVVDFGATHLGSGWSASQHVPLVGQELRRWERKGAVFLEPKRLAPWRAPRRSTIRDRGSCGNSTGPRTVPCRRTRCRRARLVCRCGFT